MWRKIAYTALLMPCLAASALAQGEANYAVLGGSAQPALAWCDNENAVLALHGPEGGGTGELLEWPKSGGHLGALQRSTAEIGRPDPGAGQVYRSLKLTAGALAGQSGYLHTSNIENSNAPGYRLTSTGPFKLGKKELSCRYVPQAAFMGAAKNYTIIIWDNGQTATYASRNYNGKPGAYIKGGKVTADKNGATYTFHGPSNYVYTVHYSANGADVTVSKGGTLLSKTPFVAYSIGAGAPR